MDVELEIQAMHDDIASLRAAAAKLYQNDPKGKEFDETLNVLVGKLIALNPVESKKSKYSYLTAQKVFDLIMAFELDAGESFTDQGGMPNVDSSEYIAWLKDKNDPEINEWLDISDLSVHRHMCQVDWNVFMDIYPYDESYDRNIMLLSQFIVSCNDLVKEEFLDYMDAELGRTRFHEKWYGPEGIVTKIRSK